MSKKSYRVVINGMRTALQLTEDEARRRGLTQVVEPAAPAAAEKPKKARAPRSKPATPQNKAAAKSATKAAEDAAGVEAPGIVPDVDGKGASGDGAGTDAG